MSSELETAPHFRVKYSSGANENGEKEKNEVKTQYQEANLIEDGDGHTQKKLPAVKRSCFKAFKVSLGVLYLLILAGITTRYISVTLEKEQLQNKYDKLRNNYSQLQTQLQTEKQLQPTASPTLKSWKSTTLMMCPVDWAKFGRSCYFKSTEMKTWPESRKDCQSRGADLVIINNKEEQEFIELNMKGDSWIGLDTSYKEKTGNHEWEWVDGSLLTEAFWAPYQQDPSHGFSAVCCEINGKWTRSHSYVSKTWICEK
ncbi:CD209 antigen-like protein C isoform X1 [Oreochromis niloticus]|nr:CD209 antigen-like protein C isoform X1 [Oreochromis niloticus]XP_039461438.1 CD209 antigen-like protein C [Oreochromis aureus]CAI5691653.1 unnamed protein product [Mustela putorius furo]